MEALLKLIVESVAIGGGNVIVGIVGWLLYLYERYHLSSKREEQHRNDINEWQEAYSTHAEKGSEALHKISTALEILKDRMVR